MSKQILGLEPFACSSKRLSVQAHHVAFRMKAFSRKGFLEKAFGKI